jgi:phosphoglycerol transferase MdoB-like AlkP superfamily enzyme
MRKPSILLLILRVIVVSFLAGLLTFAVFLLLGILAMALTGAIHGTAVNFTRAYRSVAFPAALAGFVIAFGGALWNEIAHYRRLRSAHAAPDWGQSRPREPGSVARPAE